MHLLPGQNKISLNLKAINYNNLLIHSFGLDTHLAGNIAKGTLWLNLSESQQTRKHTELHLQFLPGQEINTTVTNTQTQPHIFRLILSFVKAFQHIGECSIKENGLEHSLCHLCPSTKHTQVLLGEGNNFMWMQ